MSTNTSDRPAKITTQTVVDMKQQGEKISMLTAYDFTMAQIIDQAGIEIILVGDSASNVMAGFETTVPMTLDHMIYHTSCVVRGVDRALVIADMPFMSYQVTAKEALINAGRMMKEAGAHAVKMEGGKPIIDTVKKIVDAGIPVMGHLGLTPQSIYKFGTYKVRATDEEEAQDLINDAKLLQEAGCFSIVLEKIPAKLAERVSKELDIPTIGIGAGAGCDGQVLVLHDMLGLNKGFNPRFLRRYADLHSTMTDAVQQYISDVKSKDFPNKEEQYGGS
ncbi:MAG TPA: 3-methyl-2-oxobutanoate hydroxymethyltransferase [Balneola sp.]|jgi:3-methyl-2-oxobutanoate hydroxymethyltransferase|nr:3-methyl-2-oxobutanoate hydroxymethyltransferase [Balneola sp.]MAO78962.1 3-methyl-2-oxobutanoate hydroxymethyltransferase [Balneola sp.]MBF63621.1 3-methyl-2-oxobutanoate hydroxymethyltransferase [Balneola sp.]HAW79618.1 3-methyl-2-oxobutanoate hydroxymethyltransferase [Balneola sp.]HBZ38279.1 3-methyl-2-oxobutanoate hydroxymethyltransferase [Balneola sp.]|tara:strand:+ start:6617 stop:7447 length:831 start_codon:yes stop_codon:yes gene_type:complete